MKEFKDYTFADFERVPRNTTTEAKLANSNKYKPMKLKTYTISLKNGTHNSRPISEDVILKATSNVKMIRFITNVPVPKQASYTGEIKLGRKKNSENY